MKAEPTDCRDAEVRTCFKLWEKNTGLNELQVIGPRCWNGSAFSSQCSDCRQVCPEGAIELEGEPQVDALKCTSCGLCAAVCRAGAFVFPKLYGSSFFRALSSVKQERPGTLDAVLTCKGVCTEDATRPFLPDSVLCLAALEEVHLIKLAQEFGNLTIDCGQCLDCRYAEGADLIRMRAAHAQAWIDSFNLPGKVSVSTEEDTAKGKGNAVPLVREPAHSRRRLFKRLGSRGLQEMSRQLVDEGEKVPKQEAPIGVPERRRSLRALFLTNLESTTSPEVPDHLPVKHVSADPSCQLCSECTVRCPGKALVKYEDRKGAKLLFNPFNCLGCADCEQLCPDHALKARALVREDFPLIERVLYSREKVKCVSCEKSFLPKDETLVCPACIQFQTVDDSMLNILGWQ